MPTTISLRAQRPRLWRQLIRTARPYIGVAVCLLTGVISMPAADSKPGLDPAQKPATQQSMPLAPDGKTNSPTGADAACIVKSSDAGIVTKTGAAGSAQENADQGMSNATSEAPRREDMTLPATSKEEWDNDQIHLSVETQSKEESRSEKSKTSNAGSDLKCTPHETAPKPEPAIKN